MLNKYLEIKRINYDFRERKYEHFNESIECSDTFIERNRVKLLYNNINFEFYFNNYPFNPPIVYIINKNQEKNLLSYCPSKFPRHIWNRIFEEKQKCICCNNKMCKSNWSPAMSAMDIIFEYENFCNTVRNYINKRLLTEISYKLPDDIVNYIKEYLF